MYVNVENRKLVNIGDRANSLKELLDFLFNKLKNNFSKKEEYLDELAKIYSNDCEFSQKIKVISNFMNQLSEELQKFKSFEMEFENFLSIQTMIDYIISKMELFVKYSDFANDLAGAFCNLINFKVKCLQTNDLKKYDGFYKLYDEELFKKEEFFYLNIYQNSHQYDELIDEVTNILW